jgi:hypothetical protein
MGQFKINSDSHVELVTITNSLGQVILSTQDETVFDISGFGNGVYFVAVRTKNGWSNQKLIKK